MLESPIVRRLFSLVASYRTQHRSSCRNAASVSKPSTSYEAFSLEDRIMMSATPLDPGLLVDDAPTDSTTNGSSVDSLPDWGMGTDFSAAASDMFAPEQGTWSVDDGQYHNLSPGDAISLLARDLPTVGDVVLSATVSADSAAGTMYSNAFLIFDYESPTDFKFAGGYTSSDQWVVGHRSASGWKTDASATSNVEAGVDYRLTLTIQNDGDVTLYVDGVAVVAQSFNESLSDGSLGLGARNSVSHFDDFYIAKLNVDSAATPGELPVWEDFNDGIADHLLPEMGSWSITLGQYVVAPGEAADGVSLLTHTDPLPLDLEASVTLNSNDFDSFRFSNGFIIFDYQSDTDFKFAGAFAAQMNGRLGIAVARAGLAIR